MNFQIRQIKPEFRECINCIMIHFFSDDDLQAWCGKRFDHFKTDILLDGTIEDVMGFIEAQKHSEYEICFVCLKRQFDKFNKLKNKEN